MTKQDEQIQRFIKIALEDRNQRIAELKTALLSTKRQWQTEIEEFEEMFPVSARRWRNQIRMLEQVLAGAERGD